MKSASKTYGGESANRLASVFDLTAYEARTYLSLLQTGTATMTDIAKSSGIPRTAVYPPLQHLLEKGFVSAVRVGKRTHYEARDPKTLVSLLDRKKIELTDILGELSRSISASSNKLAINFFPGAEGITTASELFLAETKSKLWKTFEHPLHTLRLTGPKQLLDYVRRRAAKGIHGRVIAPGGIESTPAIAEHLKHDREELREIVFVSPEQYPLEASIAVTDGMVLLISAQENKFAVLVRNRELADTMSSIHDMVWDRYRIS